MYDTRSALRGLTTLALVATLTPLALGLAAPARAQDPAEPAIRVHFDIDKVVVHSDKDWGTGEISISLRVWRVNEGCPANATWESCITRLLKTKSLGFAADDGDTEIINVGYPSPGDEMADGVSSRYGIPLDAGQVYGWEIRGVEKDTFSDDRLGSLTGTMSEQNNWGLGTRFERGSGGSLEGATGACVDCPANFSVEYSIYPTRMPDLRPVNIKVEDLPATAKKRVCMAVQNIEAGEAGPIEVALRVDGVVPPDGRTTAVGPTPGDFVWICVETALPASGQHRLAAVVDEPSAVTELREMNNVYEQAYQGIGPAPAPAATPTPAPSAALPDLTVGAIKVNGRVSDGKDDCEDGKNGVAVVVKNAGAGDAGGFAVRLRVDGDQADEASVPGLEAGKEREVRFDDVRLKEGERTLTAIADAKHAVAESKEGNNELYVTAKCKDGDD